MFKTFTMQAVFEKENDRAQTFARCLCQQALLL